MVKKMSFKKLVPGFVAMCIAIKVILDLSPNAFALLDRFKESEITIELVSSPGYLKSLQNLKDPCPLPRWGKIQPSDIGTKKLIDKKCNVAFAEVAFRIYNPKNVRNTITSCSLEVAFHGTSYRLESGGSIPASEFNPHYLSLGHYDNIILEAGSVADYELVFFLFVTPEARKYLNATIYRGIYLNCVDVSRNKYAMEYLNSDICKDIPQEKFCKLLKDNNMT
jgi:hypothetical protein